VLSPKHITPDVIERRYWQGLRSLFDNYLPLVAKALVFDNWTGNPVLLVEKTISNFQIHNSSLRQQLRN